MGAALAALEHLAQGGQVHRRLAAREIAGGAGRESEIARIDLEPADAAPPHLECDEGTDGRRFVPAGRAVHHPRAFGVHAGQRLGDQFRRRGIVGADEIEARRAGIGQGSQHVEHRAHAERGADRRHRFHRRMKIGREQEGEARRRKALRGPGLIQRQFETEQFDQVGAAAAARHGPVAVLDHGQAACRREERRARRQIEAPGSVPARADDVDRVAAAGKRRRARQRAHRSGKAAHLRGRDALAAQSRQQRPGHGGRKIRRRQAVQQCARLRLAEIAPRGEMVENLPGSLHGAKF